MRSRSLGATKLKVSELGLGCSRLVGLFERDDRAAARLLQRAFDLGINFFDTADIYGFGRCEELLGRTFRGRRRDEVVIASKCGALPSRLATAASWGRPVVRLFAPLLRPFLPRLKRRASLRSRFSPRRLRAVTEASLRRLRTDRIDLLQLHSPPRDVLERADIFGALEDLKREGKIRFYGVSARTVDDALRCLDRAGLAALQIPFNLLQREALEELIPRAGAQDVGLVARVPLARGFLIEDAAKQAGTQPISDAEYRELCAERARLAFLHRDGERTLAQAALRFVLHPPQVSTAIVGTTSLEHLEANVRGLERASFTSSELARVLAPPE